MMSLSSAFTSATVAVLLLWCRISPIQAFVQPSLRLPFVAPTHAHSTLMASPLVNGATDGSTTTETSDNTQIRLNVVEMAKTVASVSTSGTLCTLSKQDGIAGAPFGSFVDYVLDDDGNPVLLMNEISMHAVNIQQNSLQESDDASSFVTLFIQWMGGAEGSNHGQQGGRCSLTCHVEKISPDAPDMDALRMRYSLTHSYADQVMDSPKFSFYRLTPKSIYYVGGFGVPSEWVNIDEYKTATPDILAKEANDIVSKLNREYHNDLEWTARHLLGVDGLHEIRVTNVDRLGMDVRVTQQKGTRRNKLLTEEFRIGFRIPVISVEDAKSEILKVFQEAWEQENEIAWENDHAPPGSSVPIIKTASDNLE